METEFGMFQGQYLMETPFDSVTKKQVEDNCCNRGGYPTWWVPWHPLLVNSID